MTVTNWVTSLTSNGAITRIMCGMDANMAALNTPGSDVLTDVGDFEVNAQAHYVSGGIVTDRPAAPVVPTTTPINVAVTFEGVQPGIVTLTDSYGTQSVWTYDPADPLILTDPGTYTISIEQTFPYHSITQQIEVTSA